MPSVKEGSEDLSHREVLNGSIGFKEKVPVQSGRDCIDKKNQKRATIHLSEQPSANRMSLSPLRTIEMFWPLAGLPQAVLASICFTPILFFVTKSRQCAIPGGVSVMRGLK